MDTFLPLDLVAERCRLDELSVGCGAAIAFGPIAGTLCACWMDRYPFVTRFVDEPTAGASAQMNWIW